MKMHRALFRLLEQKPFFQLTIQELCREAQVNRSTFYSHYTNLQDLLQEAYDSLIQELFDSYDVILGDVTRLPPQETRFIRPEYLVPYLEFVRENRAKFTVCLDNADLFRMDDTYSLLMERLCQPVYRMHGVTNTASMHYMTLFYLHGITALVREWVHSGCTDSVEFMCQTIIDCAAP